MNTWLSLCLCNLLEDLEEASEGARERLTHSEVGSREGVCGAAILADDGGGVALLAVVVTSASHAGQLADGGREDHFDPSCVVANCARKHDTSQQQASEERLSRVSYSPIHREKEKKTRRKNPKAATAAQKKRLLNRFRTLKMTRGLPPL